MLFCAMIFYLRPCFVITPSSTLPHHPVSRKMKGPTVAHCLHSTNPNSSWSGAGWRQPRRRKFRSSPGRLKPRWGGAG